MNLIGPMIKVHFRVNSNNDTTFFFPILLGGLFCGTGYRITSSVDVMKLKKYVRMYFLISYYVIFPSVIVFVGVMSSVYEWMRGYRLPALLLSYIVLSLIFTFVFERMILSGVVGKYERLQEKLRYKDVQRVQAEANTLESLVVSGVTILLVLALAVYVIVSGVPMVWTATAVLISAYLGVQYTHQLILKVRKSNT